MSEALKGWQQSLHPDDADRFREIAGRVRIVQEFQPGDRQASVRGRAQGGAPDGELRRLRRGPRRAVQRSADAVESVCAARRPGLRQDRPGHRRRRLAHERAGVFAVLLAAAGAYTIWRAVARPLARITRVTEAIAAGEVDGEVPYRGRGDEVGALARSISVFKEAMRRNAELGRTVAEDAQARGRRQEAMADRDQPVRRRGRGHAVRARPHFRSHAGRRPDASPGRRTPPRPARPARPRRRPMRRPMCATSRRRPTSSPPRCRRSTARWRSRMPSPARR